jgi:AmmeMemoRadiSam system protein A
MENRTIRVIDSLPLHARAHLLQFSRRVLEAVVSRRDPPSMPSLRELRTLGAAFVTLRRLGELRGCIGDTSFERPLGEVVARMTEAAALADPRFTPVTPRELSQLSIEISRLSRPMIASLTDIVPGRHGIIVQKGRHKGLLLPQVAVEFACDVDGFVSLACRKAGIPKTAATDPNVSLFIFEAEVFGE